MWIKQLHDVGPFIVPRITYRSNIPAMRLRSRQRLRIVLAIILCLLFQQVAMAAYACTLPSMPPDPVEMADACSQMGMEVGPWASFILAGAGRMCWLDVDQATA